jgi:hypothetical protein
MTGSGCLRGPDDDPVPIGEPGEDEDFEDDDLDEDDEDGDYEQEESPKRSRNV